MRFSQENVHCRRTQSSQAPSSQRAPATHSLAFPKTFRLLNRVQFQYVMKKGTRFHGKAIVIISCPSEFTRLGITVSRKFGNAVQRNRFKRLVREIFRAYRLLLPPHDMIISPQNGSDPLSLATITADFTRLLENL